MPDAFVQPDSTFLSDGAYEDVAMANGASLSSAIDLGDRTVVGILMPAAWTAAGLAFQGSPDNATFGKLIDTTGTEVTVAAPAAGNYITLDQAKFFGLRYLKIVSGTNGTPVAQGAGRTFRVFARSRRF